MTEKGIPLSPMPAGVYAIRVYEVVKDRTPEDTEFFRISAKVVYGAENGRLIFDSLPAPSREAEYQRAMFRWEKAEIESPMDLEGELWAATVYEEEYRGLTRTRIQRYFKLPEGMKFV